ncbi:MAG: hypothetical protein JWM88_2225 [Verrucomicrobia bacterium]|nr:hypothetical protein [Verrucomicrobiota bacterium]
MHPSLTNKAGPSAAFTLAEVMMATVVVLVAVVGLIQAVTIGSEMLDVGRKQTIAMQIVRNEIENLHLKDWATVSAMPSSAYITVNSRGAGLVDSWPSAIGQTAFALMNHTNSYTPPWSAGNYDDNINLMALAKDFRLAVAITNVSGRADFLLFNYTVTWTGGSQRMVYSRTAVTYYGRYGLNVYYRR